MTETHPFVIPIRSHEGIYSYLVLPMPRQRIISIMLTLLILIGFTAVIECQNIVVSVSQISPKSTSHPFFAANMQTENVALESTITDLATENNAALIWSDDFNNEQRSIQSQSVEHTSRVERSAKPILNENYSQSGSNDIKFPMDSEKQLDAGRYLYYQIKPTESLSDHAEYSDKKANQRSGKTLDPATMIQMNSMPTAITTINPSSSSFLLKGDHQTTSTGSPIKQNNSKSTAILRSETLNAIETTNAEHNPRQNSNPDIQDIITGIVKLLNGNVNVHANTQGLRRPIASRINNRGPPRISDAQPLPMDYEQQHKQIPSMAAGTSMRPLPPYPFDRPERPFITGVPLPEQIVPHRPGFISNHPPWHRKKPRPPITTMSGRRPVPQYKPMPPITVDLNHDTIMDPMATLSQAFPTTVHQNNYKPINEKLTDSAEDSEFSNEDTDTQYIEVSDSNVDTSTTDVLNSAVALSPNSTDDLPLMDSIEANKKQDTAVYSTIVATSSEVHTVTNVMSKYATMSMILDNGENIEIDPSAEEVIFMTPSRTPILETTDDTLSSRITTSTTTSSDINSNNQGSSGTISSHSIITTIPIIETTNSGSISILSSTTIQSTSVPVPVPTRVLPTTSSSTAIIVASTISTNSINSGSEASTKQYQPRPGIVLDDPEFKPGGGKRPQRPTSQQQIPNQSIQHHQQQQPQLHIQPTRQNLPPGYGEIFDITLSAIQGPGSVSGLQQTINIRPYGTHGTHGNADNTGNGGAQPVLPDEVILAGAGEESYVSIDGRRTYINLLGEPTNAPVIPSLLSTATLTPPSYANNNNNNNNNNNEVDNGVQQPVHPGPNHSTPQAPIESGYGIPETEVVDIDSPNIPPKSIVHGQQGGSSSSSPTSPSSSRPHYHHRPRPTPPPVRIDTCIVGDDSTCDSTQHERCKTENGISSCHCRPGYSRRKHREPCRRVLSFFFSLRVDRIYEHRIVWDNKLLDQRSEPYGQLSYEAVRAIESAMSMTPYSDEFMNAKVSNVYSGNPKIGGRGVFVNITVKLDESIESLRPNLRTDVQKHLLGVLHRRNNNIGNSVLYVTSPEGAVSALHDLDECESRELNDCHANAQCTNSWGSFRCTCAAGLRDPWAEQVQRAGRDCQSCPESNCNNHGICSYNADGNHICACDASHYGNQCEIDGEVLGVAIGASVAAVIIIVLTLVCLIMWSRRWQREQKNAIGSPVFGYMNTAPLKSAIGLTQPGYQVTLEDRMRWAQIADVMAQTNHYGAEPIAPTRPSSAMFAYPNIQSMVGIGSIGGMSMQNTLQQLHQTGSSTISAAPPPVPLSRYERLNLTTQAKGMRMENSSSSEEEDRTDLLGRNFQVPRPKSRSNGSVTNQSGIYYDVDYEPANNGMGSNNVDHLYNSAHQNQTNASAHVINSTGCMAHGIPLNTYKNSRTPSYYAN